MAPEQIGEHPLYQQSARVVCDIFSEYIEPVIVEDNTVVDTLAAEQRRRRAKQSGLAAALENAGASGCLNSVNIYSPGLR